LHPLHRALSKVVEELVDFLGSAACERFGGERSG
jgi:hypothetical protein